MASIFKTALVIGLIFGLLFVGEQITLKTYCKPSGTVFIHKYNKEFQSYDCGQFGNLASY